MKTAKISIRPCWDVNCPYCGADRESPDGSLLWEPEDVRKVVAGGNVLGCGSCREMFSLPQRIIKIAKEN